MTFSTTIKSGINQVLARLNLELESLTLKRREQSRLARLREARYFDQPAFPILPAMAELNPAALLAEVRRHRARFEDFCDANRNATRFSFDNQYFSSPDAEILYTLVRSQRPKLIVEVGSGNSTKISRLAIADEGLSTRLLCIDPDPRTDVQSLADEMLLKPVEEVVRANAFPLLQAGDMLFIDSSHILSPGNDGTMLFLQILPSLPAGVLIHIHDIFLPFDYPPWLDAENFTEQYVVQAVLQHTRMYEILWAGHYFQRLRPQVLQDFPHHQDRPATSLWLRKL